MKVVVGLGNPGKKYEHTRHNVGFWTIDDLSERLSCELKRSFRFKARIGKGLLDDEKVMLVKPETYMNNSGRAVGSVLRYGKLEASDLIVVLDDADLDFGRLRVRTHGSSGGHRGLSSIIEHVRSEDFVRVRIGIGRDKDGGELVKHVLRTFSPTEEEKVQGTIGMAAEAVLCVLRSGVDAAMNKFNTKNVA